MKISVHGVLRTQTYVHQTSPTESGRSLSVVPTTKMHVYDDGRVLGVPVISANSVRGLLRRHAARLVMEEVADKQRRLKERLRLAEDQLIKADPGDPAYGTLQDQVRSAREDVSASQLPKSVYLSLARGAYATNGIHADLLTIEQLSMAQENVFARLFGGGAFMLPGALKMGGPLVPVLEGLTLPLLPGWFARAAAAEKYVPVRSEVAPGNLMETVTITARDDFAKPDEMALLVVRDVRGAYLDHMAEKMAERQGAADARSQGGDDDEKAAKDTKKGLENIISTQCIVPGVPLAMHVHADRVTPAQAGMLLLALEAWVQERQIGGGTARGLGQFRPEVFQAALQLDDGRVVAADLFVEDPVTGEWLLDQDNPDVAGLVNECKAALRGDDGHVRGHADASVLGQVYPYFERKKKAPPPAKAGKAGAKAGAQTAAAA